MKFSFSLPGHGPLATIENVLTAGREAEALGYDSVFIADFSITHTRENHRYNVGCGTAEDVQPDSDPNVIEPFTAIAALAAQTKSIKLGTSVIQLPVYNPFIVAKQAAALDLLSGGRYTLGVGIGSAIGFFRSGYDRINFPFKKRGRIFDEYMRGMEQLWRSDKPTSFNGEFMKYTDLELYPKPKALRVVIGSGVAEKGLRRIIEFSDGVVLSFRKPAETKVNVETIRNEAKRRGRDFRKFEVMQTVFTCLAKSREEARAVLSPTIATHATGFKSQAMSTDEQAHRKKRNITVEDLLEMSFVGTADDIIKQIETFEDAGITQPVMLLTFRGTDVKSLLDAMKNFAKEVIPSFR